MGEIATGALGTIIATKSNIIRMPGFAGNIIAISSFTRKAKEEAILKHMLN